MDFKEFSRIWVIVVSKCPWNSPQSLALLNEASSILGNKPLTMLDQTPPESMMSRRAGVEVALPPVYRFFRLFWLTNPLLGVRAAVLVMSKGNIQIQLKLFF